MNGIRCFYYKTCGNTTEESRHCMLIADSPHAHNICRCCSEKITIIGRFNMSMYAALFMIMYIAFDYLPYFHNHVETYAMLYILGVLLSKMLIGLHPAEKIDENVLMRYDTIGTNIKELNLILAFVLLVNAKYSYIN